MTDIDDIRVYLADIETGNMDKRRAAVSALSGMGESAVEPLVDFLCSDTDNDARWYAASALAKIGDAAVEQLLFTLRNFPDDNVKRYAAAALAGIGEKSVAGLIEIFNEDDSITRGIASKALIRIGKPAVEPLNSFISGSDTESISHRCAVVTLHKLGSEEPESVQDVL